MPDFLSDSFVGAAGDVTGHTPDVGATWVDGFQSFAGNRPQLDGAGGLTNPAAGIRDCSCPTVPASADYYVEIVFQMGSGADATSGVGICLRNQAPSNTRCRVQLFPFINSGTQAQITISGSRISGTWPVVWTPAYSKLVPIVFRVQVSGADIRVLVNGVEKVPYGNFNTSEAVGGAGLEIHNQQITIHSIVAADVAPPPPVAFWTARNKTEEIYT